MCVCTVSGITTSAFKLKNCRRPLTGIRSKPPDYHQVRCMWETFCMEMHVWDLKKNQSRGKPHLLQLTNDMLCLVWHIKRAGSVMTFPWKMCITNLGVKHLLFSLNRKCNSKNHLIICKDRLIVDDRSCQVTSGDVLGRNKRYHSRNFNCFRSVDRSTNSNIMNRVNIITFQVVIDLFYSLQVINSAFSLMTSTVCV